MAKLYKVLSDHHFQIKCIELDQDKPTCTYIFLIPDNISTEDKNIRHAEICTHAASVFGQGNLDAVYNADKHCHEFRFSVQGYDLIKLSFSLLTQHDAYKNKIDEELFRGFINLIAEKPRFESDLRTIRGVQRRSDDLGIDPFSQLKYLNKEYEICSGTIDFTSEYLKTVASIGIGQEREVILLDLEDLLMNGIYQKFSKTLLPSDFVELIFIKAIQFARATFKTTDFTWSFQDNKKVNLGGKEIEMPAFFLQDIVKIGKGVCRHQALLVSYLLGQYIRYKRLADTSVHLCRSDIKLDEKTVAHAWVICKKGQKLFLIDAQWNLLFELTLRTHYQKACELYTPAVINRTLERASFSIPEAGLPHEPSVDVGLELELDGKNNIDNIKLFIYAGANINTQGKEKGWTAAHTASMLDDFEFMIELIRRRADLNLQSKARKNTPLVCAASENIAQLLLENGANPTIETKEGKDFLVICCERWSVKIFNFMCERFSGKMMEFPSIELDGGLSLFILVSEKYGIDGARVLVGSLAWKEEHYQTVLTIALGKRNFPLIEIANSLWREFLKSRIQFLEEENKKLKGNHANVEREDKKRKREMIDLEPESHPKKARYEKTPDAFISDLNISFLIPPEQLKVNEQIGKGGFGIVYKGFYQHIPVAVKKINKQNITQDLQDEFKREISIMASLRFPYIVSTYGVCVEDQDYSLVMEYMGNGTLFRFLHNHPLTQWDVLYPIALKIAYGISFLHSKNVIHCDLKSDNILLDGNMIAKISDFGLSKVKTSYSVHTIIGPIDGGGSARWMAPELFKGEKQTKSSDMYAYGMILWELGSKELPFKSWRNEAIPTMVGQQNQKEKIPSHTPSSMAQLISRCWNERALLRASANESVIILEEESRRLGY